MKEHPILFTGEMVRAILDGRKTQTRRVVKRAPPPEFGLDSTTQFVPWIGDPSGRHWVWTARECDWWLTCPYGPPGDHLWVRESVLPIGAHPDPGAAACGARVFYRADHFDHEWADLAKDSGERWRPSIHMPRWASRITLEVTNVRVQRVQEITEADAIAEGVGHGFLMNGGWPDYQHITNGVCELTHDTAEMSFASLWNSINAKRGYLWESNPWVWAVTFQRLKP